MRLHELPPESGQGQQGAMTELCGAATSGGEGNEMELIEEAQKEPWVKEENPNALEAVWKFSSEKEKIIECWILFKVFIW